MQRIIARLATLLFLAVPSLLEAGARTPFRFAEEATLPSGRSYSIRVEEALYSPRPGETEDDGSRWGIDGGFPATYCAVFELAIDGKPVRPLRKLFEDLSHLSRVAVAEVDGGLQVAVRGGDAHGSYVAVFTVRPHEIVREVRHGEVPDRIWERLVIHNEEAEPHF